jgi:hypothetical protein
MPQVGAAPPPVIETAAAATDQLPAAFPSTLAPANNIPALLKAADAILHKMGSTDLSLDIDNVGGEYDDGRKSIAVVSNESFYADNGQSVRALVILCHGFLCDNGTPAVNVANLPSSQIKRSAICPKADELKAEIICCWNVICAGMPPALNQAPKATPRPNSQMA